MTALPRAAAPPDKRWRHVALHPVQDSETTVFSTTGTPLADGAELVSTLDVDHHLLRIVAGSDRVNFDLLKGPSPHAVGSAIADLARGHGVDAEIDASRYPDTNDQVYEQWHAKAWLDNTVWVVDTFSVLNTGIEGETAGPHLWSHGFDIATEWFSKKIVAGDEEGNAQIAVGLSGGRCILLRKPVAVRRRLDGCSSPARGGVAHRWLGGGDAPGIRARSGGPT
jgi:hypothetical protein